jgi:hypothetical protein
MCLSGALTYQECLNKIVGAGFDKIEIKARRPFRILDKKRYALSEDILLESIDLVAYKNSGLAGRARIFAGETLIYFGKERLRDEDGYIIPRDIPHPVCQKTADYFRALNRCDVVVTNPTYHYNGPSGGCC